MIELMAAAALAAPCTVPSRAEVVRRTRAVVVYEQGRRTLACSGGRRVTLYPRGPSPGHLLAIRIAATRVAVATGSGSRPDRLAGVSLRVVDVARGKHLWSTGTGFSPERGRLVRMALDRSGALAYSVDGLAAARGIEIVNRHGAFAVDRRVNAALRSLRRAGGRFHWTYRGQPQSVRVTDPPPNPPEDCSIPPGARVMARFPAAVYSFSVYRRGEGPTTAYGCLPGGRPWALATAESNPEDFVYQDMELVVLRPPFVALDHHSGGWKTTGNIVRVYDLRAGARTLEGCGRYTHYTGYQEPSISLVKAFLSGSGRLACSRATEFDGKHESSWVTTQAAGEEQVTHDDAADVDAVSLHVEGSELVWSRGGARRVAAFP